MLPVGGIIEEWRSINGFEDLYEVSDLGRVRRKSRTQIVSRFGYVFCIRQLRERLLSPTTNINGYKQVGLSKQGVSYTRLVHILEAEAFLLNPLGLPYVAHEDDVGTNNMLSNLRWANPNMNWEDRRRLGTDITGERNSQAVLTWGKVREIRRLKKEGMTFDALVEKFGASSSCIQNVVYGTTWKEQI